MLPTINYFVNQRRRRSAMTPSQEKECQGEDAVGDQQHGAFEPVGLSVLDDEIGHQHCQEGVIALRRRRGLTK